MFIPVLHRGDLVLWNRQTYVGSIETWERCSFLVLEPKPDERAYRICGCGKAYVGNLADHQTLERWAEEKGVHLQVIRDGEVIVQGK